MEEHFPTGLTDTGITLVSLTMPPPLLAAPLLPRWVVVSFPRLFQLIPSPVSQPTPFVFHPAHLTP